MIKVGSKSIYFWHSLQFTELFQMHLPRLIFLSVAIYSIYYIKLRQTRAAQWKAYVTSHRQEDIDKQFKQIEDVLQPHNNIFEPGKQVEYDKSYTGD